MSKLNTLEDLFLHELRDIYSAEKQITKALPKMVKAADNEQLRDGFQMHLEQTREQISRLDQIFQQLGKSSRGETCKGMQGLIEEGSKMIEEDAGEAVRDAGLIGAAQRIEHYEIAAYGTARTYAQMLGNQQAYDLLSQTLEEEKMTDEKLTEVAQMAVNPTAQTSPEGEGGEEASGGGSQGSGGRSSGGGASSRGGGRSSSGGSSARSGGSKSGAKASSGGGSGAAKSKKAQGGAKQGGSSASSSGGRSGSSKRGGARR